MSVHRVLTSDLCDWVARRCLHFSLLDPFLLLLLLNERTLAICSQSQRKLLSKVVWYLLPAICETAGRAVTAAARAASVNAYLILAIM